MDILLIAGLWLDGSSAWDEVVGHLAARGRRGVPVPLPGPGQAYAEEFAIEDGAAPFPGGEPFAGPDSADLDDAARQAIAAAMIPVPEGVTRGIIHLADERRCDVPVVLVCPEFSPAQAREWIGQGELPELGRVLAQVAEGS